MKNKKGITKELVLKNKIREIQINERQHFFLFVSMIVVFNILLIASVWFVLLYLNSWYNWVICMFMLGACFALSLRTYRKIKHFHQCIIYENAIRINSIWFEINVELSRIYEINTKESILDKIFKINTKSLEFKIYGSRRKKFTLHFIEEDIFKLKQELTKLINKYNEHKETIGEDLKECTSKTKKENKSKKKKDV